MEPYNKLSDDYDKLYLKNLVEFKDKYGNQNDQTFTDFYPSFGMRRNKPVEFLVYGQAVYGWGSGFNSKKNIDETKVSESIEYSNCSEGDNNPLDWVNILWSDKTFNEYHKETKPDFYNYKYRAFRSFFWNVVYKVICDFCLPSRDSKEWSKRLVWSNLYKITGERRNPSIWERELQQPISSELVKMELDELRPKYCIVLTNLDWWQPFSKFLKTTSHEIKEEHTEIVGYELYNDTKIIVTNRSLAGNSNRFVEQILTLLREELQPISQHK